MSNDRDGQSESSHIWLKPLHSHQAEYENIFAGWVVSMEPSQKQDKSKILWHWILTHWKPLTVWHYGVKWKTLSEWMVSKTKLWRWNKQLFEIAYNIRPPCFCPAENHGMQRMHIKHSWPWPLLDDKYVYTLPLPAGGNPFNLTGPASATLRGSITGYKSCHSSYFEASSKLEHLEMYLWLQMSDSNLKFNFLFKKESETKRNCLCNDCIVVLMSHVSQ